MLNLLEEQKTLKGQAYNELTIGVPREIQFNEKRVGLTPDAAKSLIKSGFNIIVEDGAGSNAQFKDSDYVEVGAQIKPLQELYKNSDIIIKVKFHKIIKTEK